MLFGIYQDNGSGSPAGQPLVAYTRNAYCLHGSGSWGPAWQTWNLKPSDYLTINTPGSYWLCTLAEQTYGSIYHYAYTGTSYDYTYGYANYYFSTIVLKWFSNYFQQCHRHRLGVQRTLQLLHDRHTNLESNADLVYDSSKVFHTTHCYFITFLSLTKKHNLSSNLSELSMTILILHY